MPEGPVAVVVGAGLAGLRAVEGILREGFDGSVVVVGDEPHPPYNRPPLSKAALAGDEPDPTGLSYRLPDDPRVEWRLSNPVVGASLERREVRLAHGSRIRYDGLVVATGVRPLRLPVPGPTRGRWSVRTLDDVLALRRRLAGARRVVVVGGGVLGTEMASTLSRLGVEVDLVLGPDRLPMSGTVGDLVGAELLRRHAAEGTRVHAGESVAAFTGCGRVDGVLLGSGTRLPASLVVEAVGCVPDVGWLAGNGLDLADGVGSLADLSVPGHPEVVAAGDVVRVDGRRVEHWSHASDTGRYAGRSLARRLQGLEALPAFDTVPTFWSDQVGVRIHGIGDLAARDDVRVLEGSLEESAVVGFHADGHLVGSVLVDATARLPHYRALLVAGRRG